MPASVSDYLARDMACEGLLECIHGLTDLDRDVYRALAAGGEPLTVDGIADRVSRERSTAYRSIQRLLGAGLVEQDQVNYDHGGYYHVYAPVDPDAAADDMQRLIDEWHAEMGRLVREFRETYGRAGDQPVAAD